MPQAFIALIVGYLCGSIPTGVVISRIAGAQDPRLVGSKNIGATNVLRTGRKDLAALTLLFDALKGTIPVVLARGFDDGASPIHLGIAAALGAFLGHLFPIFLKFKGGKGVATFLGCLIGLAWPAALAFVVVWLSAAYLTRFSSAGALAASAATPVVLALMHQAQAAVLFALLALVIWLRHVPNIQRMMAGTESKIGQKGGQPS